MEIRTSGNRQDKCFEGKVHQVNQGLWKSTQVTNWPREDGGRTQAIPKSWYYKK